MNNAYGNQPGWGQWPAGYDGQQFGAGFPPPGGGVPPGGGPGGPDNRNRNLVIAGVIGVVGVLLVVVAVVVAMVLHDNHHTATSSHTGSTGTRTGVTSTTRGDQSATDCTPNVSSGELPVNGAVSAGGLSFPQSVAADWTAAGNYWFPNVIDAVTLYQEIDSGGWITDVTVAITNFDQSLSLADQATLMLKCLLSGSSYAPYTPEAPATISTESGRISGVATSKIDVAVNVTYSNPRVTGDDIVVIVVDTRPSTVFLGISPIGDTASRDVVQAAAAALRVASD